MVVKGGVREDKSYALVAFFILIVIVLTVIFTNRMLLPAVIPSELLMEEGWNEDIEERVIDSQILNSWCSFTYRNYNTSYPSNLTVTTYKTLFMISESELIDKTIESIKEQTKEHGIVITNSSSVRTRLLINGHESKYIIYDGIDNSCRFAEDVKIIGEAWNCGISGTSIICIGVAHITDETHDNFETNLIHWNKIAEKNGLISNVKCH